MAIVPVTFLPRYPSLDDCEDSDQESSDDETDDDYATTFDGRSPPPLSPTAKLDLVDLVGERVLKVIDNKRQYLRHTLDPTYRRRNNISPESLPKGDEQYDVKTTVIVDTSRGVVKLPIAASSIRDNSYQIPDVIKFHHPSFTNKDDKCHDDAEDDDEFDNYDISCDAITQNCAKTTESQKGGSRKKNHISTLTSMDGIMLLDTLHTMTKDGSDEGKNDPASVLDTVKPERECFDLYLSNPFLDRELQIMEALVSRPEFVSVQFDPGRMASPDLTMLLGSGPSQVVRQWTLDGPLYLPPESDDHYILSICTAFEGEIERDEGSEAYLDEMSKWIDSGDPTRNLGFLQIRTDAETLFIGLEHAENVPFLSLQAGAPSRGELPSGEPSGPSNTLSLSSGTNETATSSTLLRSLPDRLNFKMISTRSPAIRASFGLQNKSPVPIRIMRVTVGIDSADNKENARDAENIGLELKVSVKRSDENENGDINNQLSSLVLGAATSLDELFEITCSLNPDQNLLDISKEEFSFDGTVVIRGTMDTELSYNQWREETLQNPYRDEHLTQELPFTVSILNGRVEALIQRSSHPYPQLFARSGRAVSHLFFPMNQYAAVEGSEDALPQQTYFGANEIRHDLRILSNMNLPLKLVGAEIRDDDPDDTESLCNRFNVSTSPSINSEDATVGFEDIGLLSVRYKFGTKGKRGEKHQEFFPDNMDTMFPKKCSMLVTTNPAEVGTFQIPLLIFPGRPEVSSIESSEIESVKQNKALLGFEHLLSWSRSSPLGTSFIEMLQSYDDRRKTKSDSHILSKFILDKFGRDSISKPKYLPILLKMGAIDSGKVSKMNLHLTNHNPIPLSVSIDVGEIEGMSITLSRDESQATGDGKSLLDHLPKHRLDGLVQLGKNKDNPVAGLLDFLTSNEQAQEFLSKFNFRDSISLHEPAVQNSDILQLLHDWHSKASFYRESVSNYSNSEHPSKCDGNQHPPDYNDFSISPKENNVVGDSSPFIFSSEQRLAHSLTECREQDQDNMLSDKDTIKIPPGASARFEVLVRTPPHQYLKDDISHIIMSGLALSTNLGDVMPIFAVVEALQGHLQASMVTNQEKNVMSVPLQFSWNGHHNVDKQREIDAITIPRVNLTQAETKPNATYQSRNEIIGHGVPLYLTSSFSRDVRLLNVKSCNPWFSFVPFESTGAPKSSLSDETLVGFIRTNVDCSSGSVLHGGFPSYYQCVLNWFSNRLKLQPEGCGRKDSNLNLRKIDSVKRAIEVGLRRLKKSQKSAVLSSAAPSESKILPWNQTDLGHIKTGRRKKDGIISDLASYNSIGEALKMANEFGYNLLSSSFEATIEYGPEIARSTKEEIFNIPAKQNLSLSIHDLEVESVLRAPKLFDNDDDYLEFDPTIVGSVSRSFISVRNPTGVPVRVRLGVAPTPDTLSEDLHFDNIDGIASIHPYVQNGKSSVPTNKSTAYSWWDGNGAFFSSNEYGDVIRSHNNISVTGGGGTTSISLVNPSLNSQVGFLVGCGKRCGLRDKNNANSFLTSPMSSSPIGASAAAGATLKGNIRYDSPELNKQGTVEPIILAGDTSVSTIDAPAAFAIPFSALDEIVIPPFGKGKLGPVYFRPPGRHNAVGCDLAKKSGARLEEGKEKLCNSQLFNSVLYLENSLTGIEEVHLRGNSTWDHLYFIDPLPEEGKDAFGDIEFRDGMPTLLFSGSSNTEIDPGTKNSIFGKSNQHLSVVKEIVLHNGGDATSSIASVSLLRTSMDREKGGSCSNGSFRLLNCWDSMSHGENHRISEANIHAGFVLKPGENRSLFVEHLAYCGSKKEFVNLHVQLSEDHSRTIFKGRRSRTRGLDKPFRKADVTIVVGYQMDVSTFSQCVPVDTRLKSSVIHKNAVFMNRANYSSRVELKVFDNGEEESPLLLIQMLLFSTAALLLSYALHARFHAIIAMLQKIQGEPTKNVRNWNAAFRCLARSHPTSTELQTMSREQMRHDVIGRYKAKGNTPSTSLNSINGFSRDRRALMAKTSRHRTGKEGGANERTRPFSDALFHDTSVADHSSLRIHFPVGLGWRTAYSRGMIKDNSLQSTSFMSRSKALLDKRAEKAFGKDSKDWRTNETSQGSDKSEKVVNRNENQRQNSAFSVSNTGTSNGAKSENGNESLGITNVVSIESQESQASDDEGHQTNGEEWKKKSKSNHSSKVVPPESKEVETKMSTGRKGLSNKQTAKVEKKNSHSQPGKNMNTTEGSKRPQKSRNNSSKSTDSDGSTKVDDSSKNVKFEPNQKLKVAAKLASSASSSKESPHNAWQGERQKSDTKSSAKNDATRSEKKSREKEKPKKKGSKQTNNGKKSVSNSTKASEIDSEPSKATKANAKQKKAPVVKPPPGFGAAKTKTPVSPSANIPLHSVSTTDSQLSLDTMLQGDLSLPFRPPSAQLPFRNTSSGGNDLLFPSAISESNPSPTKHAASLPTESANILPSPVEQPWLPTLLNEEPEQVEQPWLPALRNEDAESGFDVMDFLDGILQDGSSADPEPVLEAEAPAQGPPGLGVAPAGNSSTPVSANPWARESRAAAYGISFDDDDENGNTKAPSTELEDILLQGSPMEKVPPPGLGGNLPLLTPAAILSAEGNNNKNVDVDKDDRAMSSFYAGLIDE